MNSSADPIKDNVVPMRRPLARANVARHEAASYLSKMALELEQLATTAGMEMVGYFLALARAEAAALAASSDVESDAPDPQAPYLSD